MRLAAAWDVYCAYFQAVLVAEGRGAMLMADEIQERVPADPAAVNLREPWEVAYWCEKFGRTQPELELAIKETGSVIVDDIAAYFETKSAAAEGPGDSR
jgi:uncharacterized protein DUF3606